MYKLNPATGQRWKKGEAREDGKVFVSYSKTRPTKDGYYQLCFADFDKWKAAQKKCRRKRHRRHQDWLDQKKAEIGGCADCGYNAHPAALDFDHLPGTVKRFSIGQQKHRCKEELEAEIAKCELVCANCHRIRTYERGRQAADGISQQSIA